jgi:hypothetical protein
MKTKSLAAPVALNEPGRHVVLQQPQLTRPPIYATPNSSVCCEAESTVARDHTPCANLVRDQRRADAAEVQEFQQIQKFVAACRRQWPGAMIVLRPDGVRTGASTPTNPKPAPGEKND